MDKESIIALQKIDCNCNDCIFMERNNDEFKASLERHHKWQLDYFETIKQKKIEKAKWWRDTKGDLEKWNDLLMEAEAMRFQFDKKEAMINYGNCTKLLKAVSFIANTFQLDTQDCFTHRRDGVLKIEPSPC